MNIKTSDKAQEHYDRLAKIYDQLWFYSECFVSFIADAIVEHLGARSSHKIVDLGGGTGIYSGAVYKKLTPSEKILCVDPSPEMLKQVERQIGVAPYLSDATSFALEDREYDRVFMKEVIHHIPSPGPLFSGIYKNLPVGGKFLLILLPPKIEYPLFAEALTLYERDQPHFQLLADLLVQTGFSVSTSVVDFPLAISKERYFQMVENRYMSLLSSFSDQQIRIGLEEMREKYTGQDILEFSDRFVLIVANK